MTLVEGTRFGHYEISGLLGAGGMGEVYRATDTQLERAVALKVLPETFASDADRVARFEREAKTLAALNHTNIAQVYGLERADGRTAIVMELIEGPTLADRIAARPIAADEALGIALQIANALEAAHGAQIVHRDLKPANIKLRPDGTVKVLDFGIAKAADFVAASGSAAQMTTPAFTQTGVILGTAAYMSPEQARGLPVDQRSDIWAFGCLLFEMLTGQPAFGGEDVMLTLARVLANESDVDSIPATIAPAVRQTIRLCLQKNPKQRIADIRDVRLALEGAFASFADSAAESAAPPAAARRLAFPLAAALLAGLVIAGIGVFALMRPEPPAVARFDVTPPNQVLLTQSPSFALSPDGKSLALLTNGTNTLGGDLILRSFEQLEPRVVVSTSPVVSPFFSPDGAQIGFYENTPPQKLKRVSIQGGTPVDIVEIGTNLRGASWGTDGRIIYATSDSATGLLRIAAAGGEPEILTRPREGEGDHYWPEILPDGKSVLFAILGNAEDESRIGLLDLASGEWKTVLCCGTAPHYAPTGYLLYGLEGTLWAVPFDADAGEVRGNPVPVQDGVLTKGIDGTTEVSLAADGTLVYQIGTPATRNRTLVWVDSAGRRLSELPPTGITETVALSPDSTKAVITAFPAGSQADIAVLDLTRPGSVLPLTRSSGLNRNPIFTPDGQRIAWSHSEGGRSEVLWQAADASGSPEVLLTLDPTIRSAYPESFSSDGSLLTLTLIDSSGRVGIGIVSVGDPDSFRRLGSADLAQATPAISPDGRWLAYASTDRGFPEIYIERFPEGGGRQPVSIDGGRESKWSADGRSLTYVATARGTRPTGMVRVPISGGASPGDPLIVGEPVMLFPWEYYTGQNSMSVYAMTADAERFLIIAAASIGETDTSRTILVQNWFTALEPLVRGD